jgi:hypothetical protein
LEGRGKEKGEVSGIPERQGRVRVESLEFRWLGDPEVQQWEGIQKRSRGILVVC